MFVGFQNQSPLLVRPCLYRCCKRDLGVCNGKNMQSWIAMFLVLPPTNQTWHATNTVVASCVNTDFWLDNIKRESRNTRELRHLLQILLNIVELLSPYCNKSSQVATTWISLNCCKKGLNLTSKMRNIAFELILQQCGKNKQITRFCCLFYRSFKTRRTITNYRGTIIKSKSKDVTLRNVKRCWER